jgi:ketosteroid isomerase-like protein
VSNIRTVKDIYAAFGRGHIPAILARLAEDIEWEYGMMDAGVPWFKPRRGREEVPEFFQALSALEFKQFEPRTLLESGDVVVALIDLAAKVKATGRTIAEENEVHIWHFDTHGLVTRFCHKADTYQHWAALQK